MRFFSKIAVLFNFCFLVAVVFRYIEKHKDHEGSATQILPLPWLEGTFVILGYTAIVVNMLFLLLTFIFYSFKILLYPSFFNNLNLKNYFLRMKYSKFKLIILRNKPLIFLNKL